MPVPRSAWSVVALSIPLVVAACGGGGGGGGAGSGPFVLTASSVSNNQIWPLNRRIVLTFSHRVDIDSVHFSSVSFGSSSPTPPPPVTGTFYLDPCSDGSVVVFQPDCPSNDGLTDGGFQPGGVTYTLTIAGGSGPNVIRDTDGKRLAAGFTVSFRSPTIPVDPPFIDTQPGAVPDGTLEPLSLPLGLNRFTDPLDPIVVSFDQPIDPRSSNLNPPTGPVVQLQFEEPAGSGTWVTVPATLTLLTNCAVDASACPIVELASIALTPTGVLPPGRTARVVVKAGLDDIGGEQTPSDEVLALFTIEAGDPAPGEGDAIDEEFDTAARLDATATLAVTTPVLPLARWEDGVLRPAQVFPSPFLSGAQRFNLTVAANQTIVIDTTLDQLAGTDEFGSPALLTVSGGVVNLHDLNVTAGGKILGTGPNPLVFHATGAVTVSGEINVDGVDATGVVLPNAADVTEPGAPGTCGGGKGGNASPNTLQSSEQGGPGFGPGDQPGLGGRGGHTCFGTVNPESRRGSGGGGGTFATAGTVGGLGGALGTDALTAQPGASGGDPGFVVFTNTASGQSANADDFFGRRLINPGSIVLTGELASLRGGAGGGAGGNSAPSASFPNPTFDASGTTGDDKGGPGGGGGGVVVVRSVGALTVAATGVIRARGGSGGAGESTSGSSTNRIGGGGGGGSGGMIVLESLTSISIATGTANNERLRVKGGAGGLGAGAAPGNIGGAGGDGIIQLHTPTVNATGVPTVILNGVASTTVNTPNVDTNAFLLLPNVSRGSRARTRWIDTGLATLGGAAGPFYEWVMPTQVNDPTNPAYPLDANGFVVAPGGAVQQAAAVPTGSVPTSGVGAQSLTIPLASLAAAGFLAPSALHGFELNPNLGQAQTFTIESGAVSGANAVLSTDPADGSMLAALSPGLSTDTSIRPAYFLLRTNGLENTIPAGATIRILFEGADFVSPAGVVTGGTNGFTTPAIGAALSSLNAKRFVRAQVEFDMTGAGPAGSALPLPEFEFFKLPIRF